MPEGFLTLVIVCAVLIIGLKFIQATVKLIVGAVILAVIVYLVMAWQSGDLQLWLNQFELFNWILAHQR